MSEKINPLAGKPAPPSILVDVPKLIAAYYTQVPDPGVAAQRVAFGTSGHRGSSFDTAFNEAHILAISESICRYRKAHGIDGPLYLGMDTHGLSEPAFRSALEVFVAHDVVVMVDAAGSFTPTPAISHAILTYNKGRRSGLADGVVITPSHNPPDNGGFKYNPPNGGPADTDITGWIEKEANALIGAKLAGVRRVPYAKAKAAARKHDYIAAYVADLANVVDMDIIRSSGVKIGIDPLGGAAVHYWPAVTERYKIDATVVNSTVDCTFRFMTVDWDGKIRMDCSSPYAMERLVGIKDKFDVAFANDTDADRHGIVTPAGGLMKPNDYLATAISYLFGNRKDWRRDSAIGKTAVSSGMIDRVAKKLGCKVVEVPVGFKWFTDGLLDGSFGFAGEESAGASFLRRDGSVWTTDKDGLTLGLLAAEMTGRTGKNPGQLFADVTRDVGAAYYERIDAPAHDEQKAAFKSLTPDQITATELAGEKIETKTNTAPGNNAPLGGIKVTTANGWFAARPSGTEDVYKIYAESFTSAAHLKRIQQDAQKIVDGLLQKFMHAGT